MFVVPGQLPRTVAIAPPIGLIKKVNTKSKKGWVVPSR